MGGLNSYCLVLMIVSFLQLSQRSSGSSNLGDLIIDFLALYGTEFNYQTTGISVTNGGSHFKISEADFALYNNNNIGTPPMIIIDPLNPSNNVGSSAYAMYRIKEAFHIALLALLSALSNSENPQSLLACLLMSEWERVDSSTQTSTTSAATYDLYPVTRARSSSNVGAISQKN